MRTAATETAKMMVMSKSIVTQPTPSAIFEFLQMETWRFAASSARSSNDENVVIFGIRTSPLSARAVDQGATPLPPVVRAHVGALPVFSCTLNSTIRRIRSVGKGRPRGNCTEPFPLL